jgi:ABC-type transport system involved in multi-copper enzyme maturation permease subunit
MLTRYVSDKRIFLFTAGSRLIIVSLLSIGVIIMSLLLVSINGILLTPADYIDICIFTLILLLTITFFFLIGILIGFVKSNAWGIAVIFIAWLIMVYIIPSIFNEMGKIKLSQIPSKVSSDREKWDLVVKSNDRGSKEVGGYRPDMKRDEHFRRVLESIYQIEDKEIQNIENHIAKKHQETISFAQAFDFLIPTTFYNSITGELSGRGVENVNEFFKYIVSFRLRFMRYFANKKHFSGDKKVESFVKARENVFTSSIRLPGNFISGTIVLVLYVVILGFVCYLRFRKALFRVGLPNPVEEPIQVKVKLKKGEFGAHMNRHHCMVDRING